MARKERFPHLLSSLKVGGHTYRNRVINAPRGGIWNEDPENNHADPEQLADARAKCAGGVAAYEIGETPVSRSGGRGANEFYGFSDFSEGHTLRYREYAETIHRYGALSLVELSHMGLAKPESTPDAPAYGPTDCVNEAGVPVTAMTEEIVARTCRDFADTAWFMKKTGHDGVVVHCGHGWLLHQFLSMRWNGRTDRFGGSLENRARLSIMVFQAIRARCGENFILEARISGTENREDGYGLDEITAYCRMIEPYVDVIHVSAGIYDQPTETGMVSTLYHPHGCNVEVAAAIKKTVSVPVAVVGGINDPRDAEQWIAQGKCDLVVLCRQLQADPAFTWLAAQDRAEEIRPCIRCMRCYPGPFEEAFEELDGQFPEGCSVNPYLLHFDQRDTLRAEQPKRVLVVGGGVAGMQAAITAAGRGHRVTLVEKNTRLGGILNFAEYDADKYDLKKLADAMAAQVQAAGVQVLLGQEMNETLLNGEKPDAVICAIGSSPLIPPIPGVERCLPAIRAYEPDTPVGDKVVMLGGGLVGCETAVHLSQRGKRVTIVERNEELAPDAYRLHKHKLRALIREAHSITVYTGTKCVGVTDKGVETDRGFFPADTVVAALGMRANPTEELEHLVTGHGIGWKAVGDCVRARKIYDAVEEGFLAAMEL